MSESAAAADPAAWQKTHPVSGLLPVTYSSRQGDHRRSMEIQNAKGKRQTVQVEFGTVCILNFES
jgi:hypothetical protein